jgi:phage tail sheath protein FI
MPEYLSPGVYIEEVSFRPKSIEGVSTSVAAFIGPTRFGPTSGPPELLTSFADFSRIYGGLDQLQFDAPAGAQTPAQDNYMAHAVRAFFNNGGTMLYVTRVFETTDPASTDPDQDKASLPIGSPLSGVTLRARFPGVAGCMRCVFSVKATPNLLVAVANAPTQAQRVSGVQVNDVVYIKLAPGAATGTVNEGLYDVVASGDTLAYSSPTFSQIQLGDLNPSIHRVHRITLSVRARRAGLFEDEEVWPDLAPSPLGRNAVTSLFTDVPKARAQYLTIPFAIDSQYALTGAQLILALIPQSILDQVSLSLTTNDDLRQYSQPLQRPGPAALEIAYTLAGGDDGRLPTAESYIGDDSGTEKTGLKTFEDVDEISIVAAPGHSFNYDVDQEHANQIVQIVESLITHCETMRYRVAVLDAPNNEVVSDVQTFRGKFDSEYAALYYPWITLVDPLDPDGRREIEVPPSGFVAGIYARTDVQYGVFKAPANEVVLGAIGFEMLLNKAQQDVLNPQGINCFRFFPDRGFRLWGARTISSDPDWKYISVRRYFAYLEHSIDKGTQWAVFENNNDRLWANIEQTVTDFLTNEWRNGALLGTKPAEAFFVRCDRSTMTQNDLDNGRLVCLIGVAVVKPAEFVIFRIGQFTADSAS